MEHSFSANSKKNLKTCHADLRLIMGCAIAFCKVDFGISEGHRTTELQQEYFNEGKSRLDGVMKKSKHQSKPSMACDVFAYVDGKANYDRDNMQEIARVVKFCAKQLASTHKISHNIAWGGDWETFVDMPHFELA